MTISLTLDSSREWLPFRLAVLKRALRLIRRNTHLGPRLLSSYRLPGKAVGRTLNSKPPREPLVQEETESVLDDEDEFCIFEVEQTLYKVHHSLFNLKIRSHADFVPASPRDPSGTVVLQETAENFRFFLWDLQAFPYELKRLKRDSSNLPHVVNRLLSITEMAIKHDLSVLETHALDSLRNFVLSPYFCSASSNEYCRTLRIATTITAQTPNPLLRDLTARLVQQILHHRQPTDPALLHLAETDPRLHTILGALYYCELIATEARLADRASTQPVFPPGMDLERRMRFLAAHISLSALSTRLCASAPPLPARGCRSHSACLDAWADVWATAGAVSNTSWIGSADVLGRLCGMMVLVGQMVSESPTISIDCGLAALEVVGLLHDKVVDGLLDHF
ncbi:hypothetical protein C8R46DRAFT_1285585, partial [Mycena filopes]